MSPSGLANVALRPTSAAAAATSARRCRHFASSSAAGQQRRRRQKREQEALLRSALDIYHLAPNFFPCGPALGTAPRGDSPPSPSAASSSSSQEGASKLRAASSASSAASSTELSEQEMNAIDRHLRPILSDARASVGYDMYRENPRVLFRTTGLIIDGLSREQYTLSLRGSGSGGISSADDLAFGASTSAQRRGGSQGKYNKYARQAEGGGADASSLSPSSSSTDERLESFLQDFKPPRPSKPQAKAGARTASPSSTTGAATQTAASSGSELPAPSDRAAVAAFVADVAAAELSADRASFSGATSSYASSGEGRSVGLPASLDRYVPGGARRDGVAETLTLSSRQARMRDALFGTAAGGELAGLDVVREQLAMQRRQQQRESVSPTPEQEERRR